MSWYSIFEEGITSFQRNLSQICHKRDNLLNIVSKRFWNMFKKKKTKNKKWIIFLLNINWSKWQVFATWTLGKIVSSRKTTIMRAIRSQSRKTKHQNAERIATYQHVVQSSKENQTASTTLQGVYLFAAYDCLVFQKQHLRLITSLTCILWKRNSFELAWIFNPQV